MWDEQIVQIRNLKIELARANPRLGPAIAPPQGAEERALVAAERRLGRRLPPSYRGFLRQHDGWPFFFQGAALLGTEELAQSAYVERSRALFESYRVPRGEASRAHAPLGHPAAMMPFGMDRGAATLFAFNPAMSGADGEMEVVLFSNGVGERLANFSEFLEIVLELLRADLADRRRSAHLTA